MLAASGFLQIRDCVIIELFERDSKNTCCSFVERFNVYRHLELGGRGVVPTQMMAGLIAERLVSEFRHCDIL